MLRKPEFLTKHEFLVLQNTYEGIKAGVIAKNLDKSVGSIYKTRTVIRKKIEKELKRTANSLRLDLDLAKISRDAGLLIGFDWVHNTKVYLFFTAEKGILAWYEHECSNKCESICKETLDIIIRERGIKFENQKKNVSVLDQFKEISSILQNEGDTEK